MCRQPLKPNEPKFREADRAPESLCRLEHFGPGKSAFDAGLIPGLVGPAWRVFVWTLEGAL